MLIKFREGRCARLEEQLKQRTEQLNAAREDASRMVRQKHDTYATDASQAREELASSERMRIAAESSLVHERQQLRNAQDEIAVVFT